MNQEQREQAIIEIIREECRIHGVKLKVDVGALTPEEGGSCTQFGMRYDLNPGRERNLKITMGLAIISASAGLSHLVTALVVAGVFPYPWHLLPMFAAIALNRHIASTPEMTDMKWSMTLIRALSRKGYTVILGSDGCTHVYAEEDTERQ